MKLLRGFQKTARDTELCLIDSFLFVLNCSCLFLIVLVFIQHIGVKKPKYYPNIENKGKNKAAFNNWDRTVIGRNIRNSSKEGELDKGSTSAKFAQIQNEGGREIERENTIQPL